MIKPPMSKTILFCVVIICATILTFNNNLTPDNFITIILPMLTFKAGEWLGSKKEIK